MAVIGEWTAEFAPADEDLLLVAEDPHAPMDARMGAAKALLDRAYRRVESFAEYMLAQAEAGDDEP